MIVLLCTKQGSYKHGLIGVYNSSGQGKALTSIFVMNYNVNCLPRSVSHLTKAFETELTQTPIYTLVESLPKRLEVITTTKERPAAYGFRKGCATRLFWCEWQVSAYF